MSVNILQNGELVPVAGSSSSSEIEKIAEISHNCMYRGKNLTNVYTVEEMYEMVHAGDFSDLYLGDYFTVSITTDLYTVFSGTTLDPNVTYYEMGGNVLNRTWTETSDTSRVSGKAYFTKKNITQDVDLLYACFGVFPIGFDAYSYAHAAILVPRESLKTGKSYETGVAMAMYPYVVDSEHKTAGGYCASAIHNATLPCFAKSFKTALNNHIGSHQVLMTNEVTDGKSSYVTATQTELCLMDELQVTGARICSSSYFDVTGSGGRFPIFNYMGYNFGESSAVAYWTRSIADDNNYVIITPYGGIAPGDARDSTYTGIKPYMIFG